MNHDQFSASPDSEAEKFFWGKSPGRIYTSRSISAKQPEGPPRNMRYVSEVIDQEHGYVEAKVKNELVLRTTPKGREQIIAKVWEDTRDVSVLTIERYHRDGHHTHEHFAFVGPEITKLKDFLDTLDYLEFSPDGKHRIEVSEVKAQQARIRSILETNADINLLIEIAQTKITKADVVALAYRREQLKRFQELLEKNEPSESVWQAFFENNVWIFGYGLNYVFNTPLDGRKLEQVVRGADITSGGKRVDGLLKSRGIISSLGLVEIKTPEAKLLKPANTPYRADCWQISDDLTGGIAQVQKTVEKTVQNISGKLHEPRDESGDPTGEKIFAYEPKAYLIIGTLAEFATATGINREKYSSFELFRRNTLNPDIITFDELFERARHIVQSNEENRVQIANAHIPNTFEQVPDDLPF